MSETVQFELLELPISNYVKTYPTEIQRDIYEYLNHLSDLERNAYQIAFNHLGSSFNITRSNGFKSWRSTK